MMPKADARTQNMSIGVELPGKNAAHDRYFRGANVALFAVTSLFFMGRTEQLNDVLIRQFMKSFA